MNIITIIQTLHKLKAGLAAVMDNDPYYIKEAKRLYYQNITIYADEKEKEQPDKENVFYEFLKEMQISKMT